MARLTCENLSKEIGFQCRDLGSHLAVCTPLTHADKTPIHLYFGEQEITDDGNTLLHFHGLGLFDRPRLASAIENRVVAAGGEMRNGEILVKNESDDWVGTFGKSIAIIQGLLDYENQLLEETVDQTARIEEVVEAIERRNPGVGIERNPLISGITHNVYRFDLKAHDTLIDLIRPHGRTTGSALRKAADVEKADYQPPLVILDDTDAYEAAKRESTILSTLVRTMLLSELKHGSGPIQL